MKVYISGAITGTDDYMERFQKAEDYLRSWGYEVVNPAKENAHLPEGTSWRTYMGESLRLLAGCDGIYMLDGWSQSKGAAIEYWVSEALGIELLRSGRLEMGGVV